MEPVRFIQEPIKKRDKVILSIFAIAFFILALYGFKFITENPSPQAGSRINRSDANYFGNLNGVIMLTAGVTGCGSIMYHLSKLGKPVVLIEVDDMHVVINNGKRQLDWGQIRSVRAVDSGNQKAVVFELVLPESYIATLSGPEKKATSLTMEAFGTPLAVSTGGCDTPPGEIARMIGEYL